MIFPSIVTVDQSFDPPRVVIDQITVDETRRRPVVRVRVKGRPVTVARLIEIAMPHRRTFATLRDLVRPTAKDWMA